MHKDIESRRLSRLQLSWTNGQCSSWIFTFVKFSFAHRFARAIHRQQDPLDCYKLTPHPCHCHNWSYTGEAFDSSDTSRALCRIVSVVNSEVTRSKLWSNIESDLDRGLRLQRLNVHCRVDECLANSFFQDLRQLDVILDSIDGLSWLHQFVSRHRNLIQVTFYDEDYARKSPLLPRNPLAPFSSQFLQESRARSLTDAVAIKQFNIGRFPLSAKSPFSDWNQWTVTDLSMHIRSSIIGVLRLASDIFPSLTSLTLWTLTTKEMFHINTFLSCIAKFPLLRTLHLFRTLDHLYFANKRPAYPGGRCITQNASKVSGAIAIETAVRQYAAYIAAALTAVGAVYFEEPGFDKVPYYDGWVVKGWYIVEQNRFTDSRGKGLGLEISPSWKRFALDKPPDWE
ncbi:hypothetical protein C8J56DRAFT_1023951 [Mycena floridula]|nr:hypothetical protein C8J56DRAFT_1023951 [Mycena floridula]